MHDANVASMLGHGPFGRARDSAQHAAEDIAGGDLRNDIRVIDGGEVGDHANHAMWAAEALQRARNIGWLKRRLDQELQGSGRVARVDGLRGFLEAAAEMEEPVVHLQSVLVFLLLRMFGGPATFQAFAEHSRSGFLPPPASGIPFTLPGHAVALVFSAIGLTATWVVAYRLTRNRLTSALAVLVTGTSLLWVQQSHMDTVDLPLASLCMLTLWLVLEWSDSERRSRPLALALLLACAAVIAGAQAPTPGRTAALCAKVALPDGSIGWVTSDSF